MDKQYKSRSKKKKHIKMENSTTKKISKSTTKHGTKHTANHATKPEIKHQAKHVTKSEAKHTTNHATKHASKRTIKHGAKHESNHASKHAANKKTKNEENETSDLPLSNATKDRIKHKMTEWLDFDDKITEMNDRIKKYKTAKKKQGETILKLLGTLGMEDKKFDIKDDDDNFRGRVYRFKSVTRGGLNEKIIKNALMEALRDEKKVDQLTKKITKKRTINEHYYLKRTKGSKNGA